MKMSLVVRTTTKLVAPFLVTYGAYLTIYGYESPGGGFQAGVIFAVSVILLMTAYGYRRTRKHFPLMTVQLVESSAALFIVGVALMGLVFGSFFLNFLRPYIPGGTIMTFNIGVALKVGTSFILVFYILSRWADRD
ncbi:Na(+)/H(+) antiporter subunit B [Thermococcus peptonophilus]|uniref:Cation:proton antiporter n=1 Tax=Thermococcus peptonophilus TaxID=53952 RepID=A0A142CXJ5_9EURY|nr:Na(+)/H(+) antiporter subunit B [Thermococcus peptonophilus]AMQ19497.1 cation:proton antiporter [Thermococcus peptonophilus]